MTIVFYVWCLLLFSVRCEELDINRFPKDFMFGVSTSAYQIEGAWNESGKGESIWDRFTHKRPELIDNKSDGDVSCNSYYKLQEDVKLLKELGVDFYKFSFSWSRILPSGFSYNVNNDAILYYNELINLLIANDIKPVATIFNWDLPQTIQEMGGFTNKLIIDWFEDYAKVLFKNFGDRIKFWITINDPQRLCSEGYGSGKIAPGVNASYIATYMCGHYILMSHAKVFHLYDTSFKISQNGQVSIALDSNWQEPDDASMQEINMIRTLHFSWFADPIFGNGTYPIEVEDAVKQLSLNDNFTETQLPKFTDEESRYIQGSSDFCAVNYYDLVKENTEYPQNFTDERFRRLLNFIKERYGSIPILVTGSGLADKGELNDDYRFNYLKGQLKTILDALLHDNMKFVGYGVWSLLDNFDWNNGYLNKYGLYYVNFTDSERSRVPKLSAKSYSSLLSSRKIGKSGAKRFVSISMIMVTSIFILHAQNIFA